MFIPKRAILLGASSAVALAFTAAPALTQMSSAGTGPGDDPSIQMQRVPPRLCRVAPLVETSKARPYALIWPACGGGAFIGSDATVHYKNDSGVKHRLKVGSFTTEAFSTGVRMLPVHFALGTTVRYECTLHPGKMHGTLRVVGVQ